MPDTTATDSTEAAWGRLIGSVREEGQPPRPVAVATAIPVAAFDPFLVAPTQPLPDDIPVRVRPHPPGAEGPIGEIFSRVEPGDDGAVPGTAPLRDALAKSSDVVATTRARREPDGSVLVEVVIRLPGT